MLTSSFARASETGLVLLSNVLRSVAGRRCIMVRGRRVLRGKLVRRGGHEEVPRHDMMISIV